MIYCAPGMLEDFLHSERTEWGLAQCLFIITHVGVRMQLLTLVIWCAGFFLFFFNKDAQSESGLRIGANRVTRRWND